MASAQVAETFERTFHGDVYLVHVQTQEPASLEVEVEHREHLATWRAQFSAKYIEEITQRTHNFKSFPVFVRMLLTALRQESESVFVDLLTYGDLELLKTKRAGQQQAGSSAASAAVPAARPASTGPAAAAAAPPPANNKRYLILTYAAEFDRVHYPLPLQHEEPGPARLKTIIKQLRQQLGAQQPALGGAAARRRSDLPELRALREENSSLRQQLSLMETRLSCGLGSDVQQLAAEAQETVKDLRQMRKERDALMVRAQQAEAALEGERNLHRRELKRKMREQQDLAAELVAAKDQLRELRLKCRELTQELDLAQRRAKVANLSASYLERARQVGPGAPGRSAATTPLGSRGVSPAASRQPSRGASPAPARRVLQPGPSQRSRSAGPERPTSRSQRFDPTEYVRQQRDRQRKATDRLEDMRRQQRLQLPSLPGSRPGSRPQSLPGSRPSSMPNSRHSTPARSRGNSREPSTDRGRTFRDPRDGSRGRAALARSTERLRGAISTTVGAYPPKEQRAASPGRALLEVKARLSKYAAQAKGPELSSNNSGRSVELASSPVRPGAAAGGGGTDLDATCTEIADIDARLQSLQQFLKAAKAGAPARAPI